MAYTIPMRKVGHIELTDAGRWRAIRHGVSFGTFPSAEHAAGWFTRFLYGAERAQQIAVEQIALALINATRNLQ